MNPSEYVGVDAINLVQVAFTSDVDTSYTPSSSSWSCCISATSSYIKSTIANGDRPLAALTRANLFLVSYAIQSLFTNFIYQGWVYRELRVIEDVDFFDCCVYDLCFVFLVLIFFKKLLVPFCKLFVS